MAPKNIQTRITDKFTEIAEAAGLELIYISPGQRGVEPGTWLIMDDSDGLDTRLSVEYRFELDHAKFELSGQAADKPGPEFFTERGLFVKNAAGRRTVQLRAQYEYGDQLRKIFDVVTDLLRPFATRDVPTETFQAVFAELRRMGVVQPYLDEVMAAALMHGQASRRLAADRIATVTWDQPSGAYSMSLTTPDEDDPEDTTPLLLWVHGQDSPHATLHAEVRFAGESRLDALSTSAPEGQALVTIHAALEQGVIEYAHVSRPGGPVVFDSEPQAGQ